ncbi:hypothetical protein [Anaerofustis stercorihominis]|uniref:Uncharacterized protein n=1 Tax=Anaerofustis stercorihominis TaxID=214853 RepID=A0A3E3E1B4_9FIRM|nr:hypothetical protein [Anaerofustis stercorihominis]RGD75351.1 hypothetical protein DW687_03225 [Anaerofustis stercorihominis]
MALTPTKFIPNEMKTSIVKIYAYDNNNLIGTLYNPYLKVEKKFLSTFNLLNLIEQTMDDMDYPQAINECRTFVDNKENKEELAIEELKEKEILATFNIKVLFRQNATWQGSIVWVEDNTVSQFRSVYELLVLMDSVLK